MLASRIVSGLWSHSPGTTEVRTIVDIAGRVAWEAKELMLDSSDPDEINAVLDEQLTSARAYLVLELKNERVERGLAELQHAAVIETRELDFDVSDARGRAWDRGDE